MVARVLLIALLYGCYDGPHYDTCRLLCTSSCPTGQQCGSDGLCHAIGREECGGVIGGDGSVDAPAIDAPRGCWGRAAPPFVVICPEELPGAIPPPVMYNTVTVLNTDTGCTFTKQQPNAPSTDLCVIAAQQFGIAGLVFAVGTRPLLLLGADTIELKQGSRLDVSAQASIYGTPANANQPCDAPSIDGVGEGKFGAGGGAGGSFNGFGGDGGKGGSTASDSPGGSRGVQTIDPKIVRGGCIGGRGGRADLDGTSGGTSGGAVYLMSMSITIDGTIDASGGPGGEAMDREGGAGGGSGGMILLDAQTVNLDAATIYALGGGGGSGGAAMGSGQAGGVPAGPTAFAPGGLLGGGRGGQGSSPRTGSAGDHGADNPNGGDGGGGGGGGGGFIFIAPAVAPNPQRIAPDPN